MNSYFFISCLDWNSVTQITNISEARKKKFLYHPHWPSLKKICRSFTAPVELSSFYLIDEALHFNKERTVNIYYCKRASLPVHDYSFRFSRWWKSTCYAHQYSPLVMMIMVLSVMPLPWCTQRRKVVVDESEVSILQIEFSIHPSWFFSPFHHFTTTITMYVRIQIHW